MEIKTFTNPRTSLTVNDWPSGTHRTTASFYVETWRGQERVARTTKKRSGMWSKPVKTTCACRARIVDGSDGLTYIASYSPDSIYIMRGTMKTSADYIRDDDPRFGPMQRELHASMRKELLP